MITPERIRTFLDKQRMPCNVVTLQSIYDAVKEMETEEARLFIKVFYLRQFDKLGAKELDKQWLEQQTEITEAKAKRLGPNSGNVGCVPERGPELEGSVGISGKRGSWHL